MQFLKMPGISAYLGIANEKRETRKLVQNNTFFWALQKKSGVMPFKHIKLLLELLVSL